MTVILRGLYRGELVILDRAERTPAGWSGRPRLTVYPGGRQELGDGEPTLYSDLGFVALPPL